MGIKHLSYLDLDPGRRRNVAAQAQQQLKGRMADPTLLPGQVQQLQAQIQHLDKWADGELPQPPPPQAPVKKSRSKGKKHTVVVSDQLDVKDKL